MAEKAAHDTPSTHAAQTTQPTGTQQQYTQPTGTQPASQQGTGDGGNEYFGPNDAQHATVVAPAIVAPDLDLNTLPGTPTTEQPPIHVAQQPAAQQPAAQEPVAQDARFVQVPLDRNPSAIRLRRLRGPTLPSRIRPVQPIAPESLEGNRRRSSSEPQRPVFPATASARTAFPPLAEASLESGRGAPPQAPQPAVVVPSDGDQIPADAGGGSAPRRRRLTFLGPSVVHPKQQVPAKDCYDSRIVDFLDVVDPEVATLSSITNIQNSLFVPSLGKWINRRPTYDLSELPPMPGAFPPSKENVTIAEEGEQPIAGGPRSPSLSSVLSEPQYAILPNDASLEGWPEEDIKALNDYVRHMLHSRRSKIKQRIKAFGKYASRPLGFLVTLYATLITLFGLAWVLFLIGWIYVGDRQLYIINVIDYILVALFAIVGDGLAPFRAIDTYHMVFIAHYHRKTWKMRKRLLLPKLRDHNDLPTQTGEERNPPDLEAQNPPQQKDEFVPVLSDKEQARLVHHQIKLAKSHTFYKPHETETHHAFPLRLLIAVVLLLDLHSCLQISLGACTWGIPYDSRPTALTTTILCCSITANILAGVLISIGDRRTRKRDVLDRLLKQDLTGEVMKKMRKKKEKEAQKEEAKRNSEDWEDKAGAALNKAVPGWVGRARKSGEQDRTSTSRSRETRTGVSQEGDRSSTQEKAQRNDDHQRIPRALPVTDEES